MKKIIHHLKRQPEEPRRDVLHIIVFVAGIILLFLWIYSLRVSLSDSDTQTKAKQDLAPFSGLKDDIIGGYQNQNTGN